MKIVYSPLEDFLLSHPYIHWKKAMKKALLFYYSKSLLSKNGFKGSQIMNP
jgi:hypothetical protein